LLLFTPRVDRSNSLATKILLLPKVKSLIIGLAIGLLTLATISCTKSGQYEKIVPSEETSRSERVTKPLNHHQIEEAMLEDLISKDAVVKYVMESWPLQLSLQTSGGDEQVALAEETVIKRAGVRVAPGVIEPGQRVRVTMRTTNGYRIVSELEIFP
jgi:hypothetical protein